MKTITQISSFAEVFASFVAQRSGFTGVEKEELAELCSSLIGWMQDGHTCLGVNHRQEKLLLRCPLVSETGDGPLVLFNSRLYLARYF